VRFTLQLVNLSLHLHQVFLQRSALVLGRSETSWLDNLPYNPDRRGERKRDNFPPSCAIRAKAGQTHGLTYSSWGQTGLCNGLATLNLSAALCSALSWQQPRQRVSIYSTIKALENEGF
jgi:hypothetical protein